MKMYINQTFQRKENFISSSTCSSSEPRANGGLPWRGRERPDSAVLGKELDSEKLVLSAKTRTLLLAGEDVAWLLSDMRGGCLSESSIKSGTLYAQPIPGLKSLSASKLALKLNRRQCIRY